MTPSKFRWGLYFIAIGFMILAVNADWLDGDYWLVLLGWWPLLLIELGVEKIFLKSRLEIISYLAPVGIVLFMAYVAVQVGPDDNQAGFFSDYRWSKESDKDVRLIQAVINHGDSDIRINRSLYDMAEARFDRFSRKPEIKYDRADTVGRIEIDKRAGLSGNFLVFNKSRTLDDWSVYFTDEIPLELECFGDKADVNLNLERMLVRKVKINDDNGEIFLRLGDNNPVTLLDIEGDGARFTLRIPEGAGLKIFGDTYSGYLENLNFTRQGDSFRSNSYDSAGVRLELRLDSRLEHLSIDYY